MMDQRGWGWTASEIRQAQLIEWIVPQSGSVYVPVGSFYKALPDQAANTFEVANSDLRDLGRRSLLDLALGLGGMDALDALATPQARDLAEQMQATRADKRRRKEACRDAMVAWLYSCDATSELEMVVRENMLADPGHGLWFAEPFTEQDLGAAAAWLHRQGLVEGREVAEAQGPVLIYLTDDGVTCAEDFGSDTGRYLEAQQRGPGSGTSIVFGGDNHGQVAGDYAHQVQNNGASAEHLRELITGIAEIVRVCVPGVSDADEAQQEALAAAGDGAVDRPALERFRAWALSTLQTGATSAIVAAVSSATTAMLLEAARLTGHLG